jgi:hypothetical protein
MVFSGATDASDGRSSPDQGRETGGVEREEKRSEKAARRERDPTAEGLGDLQLTREE